MEEVWRPIPGYEGKYEVSNQGRVRSLDRRCLGKDGRSEFHHGKLLRPVPLLRGRYLEVYLCDGKTKKHRTIHSLVAEVFIGPRPKGYDVMHLDGNRRNNAVTNLRYGTRSENLRQTYDYGGKAGPGKLTKEQALDAKRQLSIGTSLPVIAAKFGVTPSAIGHIKDGKNFSWLREEAPNG